MANLLFEIGTEELPAHYMPNALKQLAAVMGTKLTENRIPFEEIIPLGTPRRLTVVVQGISARQRDVDELVKGPSKKAAYDSNGEPSKALNGFMRSQGITDRDIFLKQVDGVEYVYFNKTESGKETKDILKTLLPEVILSLNFPKSMRWRDYSLRFARPIRWIVALLGRESIEFSIEGVSSATFTKGHRTLSDGSIGLGCAEEYVERLKDAYVMVSPEERRTSIEKQVRELARQVGGKAVMDKELLEEVVFLVEYPTALLGSFGKEFLELPGEVVITPMREHQRYFHVVDETGKLLPCFITVRNGNDEHIDIVRAGNERVLQARLKDAQFFYREDLKVSLEDKVEKLKTVVFQEKLGTVYDKVSRIRLLAGFLGSKLSLTEAQMSKLQRAALLCKADLVTGMVNEFDELQGTMGREYALKNGEDAEVAEAIYSHYLPRYSGDNIPIDGIGQVLSIADKLDSCVGIFGIGLQPTGSQDPYALRRSCISILSVITAGALQLDLGELIRYSIQLYGDKITVEQSRLHGTILDFFKQRLRVGLIERGYRFDIVDVVLGTALKDINEAIKRIEVISDLQARDVRFRELLTSLTRVFNLSAKADGGEIEPGLFENDSERSLYTVLKDAKGIVIRKIIQGEVGEAISALYDLIDPIHAFFESTMVNVEEDAVRRNRLSLLKAITDTALQVCDFTKIA